MTRYIDSITIQSVMRSFLDLSKNCDIGSVTNLDAWQSVAKRIPELIENGNLRKVVMELKDLDLNEIKKDLGLIQRTYTIFTFIAHGFIRGRSDDDRADGERIQTNARPLHRGHA